MSLDSPPNLASDRLESLSAYLTHLRGDDLNALQQLEGKTDAQSLLRRLDILLERHRYAEAAELVSDLPLHALWCDKAAAAFSRNGELDRARQVLEWAKENADRTTWRRCLLRYADARYNKALERTGPGSPILPSDLTLDESAALRDALDVLRPNLLSIEAVGRVENEIESLSIQIGLHASSLLGDHAGTERLVKLLTTRTPLPLTLPRLALDHMVVPPVDLPQRVRADHPNSFVARLLATLLEAESLTNPVKPFDDALALVTLAESDEDRLTLCKVLNEIAQHIGDEALAKVDAIASALLPVNDTFRRLLYADRAIRNGTLEEARTALDSARDEKDPYWLQLYGNYLLQLRDGRSAVDYFARASELYPNAHLLRTAARVATDFNRLPIAQHILERLLTRESTSVPERIDLALLYARQSLFDNAAEQFAVLRQLAPNNPDHTFNHALSLWRAGRLDESLKQFDSAGADSNTPVRLLIARAELLQSMGRPADGFSSLIRQRDKHWDNYHFVHAVLELAYAAQHEDIGQEALKQMEFLQREGKAPPDILQRKTIDDLKHEILKYRERTDLACRFVLQNRAPWLFADQAFRYPTYWAWTIRTQELSWISDDPITRSQYAVYATNAYAVRKDGNGDGHLEPIIAASAKTPVVADISALLTLDSLGMLGQALDYFGQMLIPADYLSFSVAELDHLRPHQPSRRVSMEAIKNTIDVGNIHVADSPDIVGRRPFPFVHEHTLEEDTAEHYYRLMDLCNVLRDAGQLSESDMKQWVSVAHKGAAADADHPALVAGSDILVHLSTLMTIAQLGALRSSVRTFKVHILKSERDELIRDLNGYTLQDRVLAKHERLWNTIRSDPRVVQRSVEVPHDWKSDNDQVEMSFASALLAKAEAKPLFADDRTLQTLALNSRIADPTAAFGTDALLLSLQATSFMNTNDVYHAILQLMAWRYRFIVPTPEMLKHFAVEYSSNPPGHKLLVIARYFHESMQDPGLLAGFEPTTPPTSIASRLFLTLTGATAEFVMDLWLDESISESTAKTFTEWAMRELLPSPPKSMGIQGDLIASIRPRVVFSRGLIRGCVAENVKRAHSGLRAMAEVLGMSDAEYWAVITEVIGDI